MSNAIDVFVLDADGDPIEGCKVKVIVDGIFSGGALEEFTDEDGHAEFETAGDYEDSREINIYVRGQSFGPYSIGGGAFTVELE